MLAQLQLCCLELQRRLEGASALCIPLPNPIKYDVICWASIVLRWVQWCRTNTTLKLMNICCTVCIRAGPVMYIQKDKAHIC